MTPQRSEFAAEAFVCHHISSACGHYCRFEGPSPRGRFSSLSVLRIYERHVLFDSVSFLHKGQISSTKRSFCSFVNKIRVFFQIFLVPGGSSSIWQQKILLHEGGIRSVVLQYPFVWTIFCQERPCFGFLVILWRCRSSCSLCRCCWASFWLSTLFPRDQQCFSSFFQRKFSLRSIARLAL